MLIDAHVHIFPGYRSKKAVRWLRRYIPRLEIQDSVTEEEILNRLSACDVSCFFNYVYPLHPDESEALNEFNHELSTRIRKAVCFASVHPENEDKQGIVEKAILDLGLIGLKFHPFVQGFNILDKRMDEVYRTMEILNRPVVFHTGFDRFYRASLDPNEIEIILQRYPGLVLVISHMFYPRINKAFELLERYENVYLDGTNVFSDYWESAGGDNVFEGFSVQEVEKQIYRVFFNHPIADLELFSHRVMVGSDYPVSMNYPENIYEHVRNLEISPEAKKNILGVTAGNFVKRFMPDLLDHRFL